jgi:hypothetical protein
VYFILSGANLTLDSALRNLPLSFKGERCPDSVGTGEVSDADLTLKIYTSSNYIVIR